MILSNKKGVQHVVLTLAKLGLKEVVICPGSRNAPLTISFNRHADFHCTSIRDERSAAFFALGKALESKQPVAIVCTSGSAALNFAPAIVEAYYQRTPLIVLTADRSKEWTDQGDGQTINQTNIYRNFIRKSYDLKGDTNAEVDLWYNERCINEGFSVATIMDKGPVHFNIPMNEPLYETEEVKDVLPKIFSTIDVEKQLSKTTLAQLSHQFHSFSKVMILVGQHPQEQTFQDELSKIANYKNVVVSTESTANVHHPLFVENIDRCITGLGSDKAKELMPELLITLGGAIVSKRVKTLLRKYRPNAHWNVHPYDSSMDTYQALTTAIPVSPVPFLRQLLEGIKVIGADSEKLQSSDWAADTATFTQEPSDYLSKWQQLKKEKAQMHQHYYEQCDFSDFKAFGKIYEALPEKMQVHFSNSSSIRYAQLFDNSSIAETWCNRGTSGIDGCTSTVMGAAAASPKKDFLLITGDVAFHYDSNALWNEESVWNLKIIVLNNGGGGIFRIIDGPNKVAERSRFLETAMEANVEKMAEQYQWNYLSAKDGVGLEIALKTFFNKENKRMILEIFTDAATNPEVLKKYWEFLK